MGFERVREKIKRYFNEDCSRVFQDLLTFDLDAKGKIQMADVLYYFDFNGLKLVDAEQKSLMAKFKVVRTSRISPDFVTSMIFYGKANLKTLSNIEKSVCQQHFFSQVKNEISISKKSSFLIYQ